MDTNFLDPKDKDQWKKLFIETTALYNEVKIDDPIEIAEGEVLSLDQRKYFWIPFGNGQGDSKKGPV